VNSGVLMGPEGRYPATDTQSSLMSIPLVLNKSEFGDSPHSGECPGFPSTTNGGYKSGFSSWDENGRIAMDGPTNAAMVVAMLAP
jgi:hypothetical protein